MVRAVPFQLMDGQKAYAAKLMGNFNYLLGILDGVEIPGINSSELNDALLEMKDLIDQKISASENGNAKQIVFLDGANLQAKLDNGDLNGTDGVVSTSDGLYYFYVGGDGHLYLVTRSQVQGEAFSINNQGHLIYTVDDPPPESGEPKTYDLGSVRFGGVSSVEFENYKTEATDYVDTAVQSVAKSNAYSKTLYAGSWSGNPAPTSVEISLSAMTASCNFVVGPRDTATVEQRRAWRSGAFSVTDQSAGAFVLTRDGDAPKVDIPLSVVIFP